MTQIPEIYQIAIEASIEASKAILEVYNTDIGVEIKKDGSPVTEADLASSEIIFRHLSKTSIPVTGEELTNKEYEIRSSWTENWCVDPLDGTKMFIQRNDEFAVNIAHIVKGKAIFGLIADPVQSKIIIGGSGIGVYSFSFEQYNSPELWKSIHFSNKPNSPIVIACSRSTLPQHDFIIQEIINEHGKPTYLKKGSALKFFDLAEGNADIYLRLGPTMEWDIAAGQAIIEALNGVVLDLNSNKPLSYNKKSLYNPPFIVKTNALRELESNCIHSVHCIFLNRNGSTKLYPIEFFL